MTFACDHILSMIVHGRSWHSVNDYWMDGWMDEWKSDFAELISLFRNKIFKRVELLNFCPLYFLHFIGLCSVSLL